MAYTRAAYRLHFFGSNPTYVNGQNNPTSVALQGVFKRRYVNDSNPDDFEESGAQLSANVDLLLAPTTQVTVATGGGVTVTHAQLAALIRKVLETSGGI